VYVTTALLKLLQSHLSVQPRAIDRLGTLLDRVAGLKMINEAVLSQSIIGCVDGWIGGNSPLIGCPDQWPGSC
jgi:hypothetical protein